MLSYPSAISLSSRTLNHVAELIRTHRAQLRSRWRRLDPGRQALLVLAHLRNGDTYQRLAAGFGIGLSTAWRYIHETVDLLATAATDARTAAARAARLAYAILDGTLVPIDRVAAERPYYSGKHKRHGLNVQVLADPRGNLVWASPALPGAVHDLNAARTHHLTQALTDNQVMTFADKGYQGAGGSIRTPFKRRRHRPPLSVRQREVNRCHARIRGIGERAVATLKTWAIPTNLRCCPQRGTPIVQAILALETVETSRYAR